MSTEENKAIVHRAFEELFNQRNVDVIDERWAKEFIHNPGQEGLVKWKERMVSILLGAPPDLHLAIEDVIAEGDKVVVRFTWSFTHTAPIFGAAPTGKYISWTGISINRLRDGKIAEEWANVDNLSLQRQLGKIA
jgi:predicted ester cyclase